MQLSNNFIPYFKGLQLASDSASAHAVYGFNDSVIVRIYYHESGLFTQSNVLNFTFYNGDNTQFNQVRLDRSTSPLSVFNSTNKEVAASGLNNEGYMQYLTGFVTKIKFPTIRSLLLRPDYTKLIKALLIVKPLQGSYNYPTDLPPTLLAYTTDQLNGFDSPLSYPTVSGYQNGSLVIDPLYGQNTEYTYDVTSYLQSQIGISYDNQNGLILSPASPASISTLNRLVIGDPKNNAAVQLNLYYVSVTP